MLILLTTIVFCHYLIRFCMLGMRRKCHDPTGDLMEQSHAGGIARPREPIRVILARDEELGLQDNNMVAEDKEIAIPPPPPAYGLWRCSVVGKKKLSNIANSTYLMTASRSEPDPLATSRTAFDLRRSTVVDARPQLIDSTSKLQFRSSSQRRCSYSTPITGYDKSNT